jgi:hypothetical protein
MPILQASKGRSRVMSSLKKELALIRMENPADEIKRVVFPAPFGLISPTISSSLR